LPCREAFDLFATASTFAARVAGIDAGGDDPAVPGFVLRKLENAPLHPEGPLAVAPFAILALLWFELAQMLEDQNAGSLVFGKLNNTSTHQVRKVLIGIADMPPEVGIILLPPCDDASP
jgi:hypothetical protein